ncbi:Aldo/keto reductase [Tilletiopsis washingtonensis]|uniref:Aldo/keto reductase n=1 Tax=Tilletiopsis washingtonensis TaxID=58919 RepID=A0A316Z4V3_9BASI|nr:Aldo/keto reductase [Tilletiopsis washingtonensis]PWN95988.1 Aldo/keto reductase [Tilletiopsis washingtonensis]
MSSSSYPQRPFGKTGAKVSAIGYGAMGLSAFYGKPKSQQECDVVFDRLVQLGINFWDTSDIYTSTSKLGENEERIGTWFASSGKRDSVFLCTKWAFTLGEDGSRGQRGDAEYAQQACDASLKRLQTDRIDLYYHHRPMKGQISDSARGMKACQDAGKIRFVGVSEYSLEQLKEFNEICHIDAYQIEISPWTPQPLTNGLVEWCVANGTAIVPYSPLGRGFLTGKFSSPKDFEEGDFRGQNARFAEDAFEHNLKLVDSIKSIASKKGATPGQISLAWLLAKEPTIIPIPGSTKVANIEENAKAAEIKLSAEEVASIDKLVHEFKCVGERYPEAFKGSLAF